MRVGALFALALILTGCDADGVDLAGLLRTTPTGPEVTRATVTSSDVSVSGPYGFCIDPVSTSRSSQRAFVVFGNCAAISGSERAAQPYVDAVAFVTVSALSQEESASLANPSALEAFLISVPGKATISRSGQADSVEVFDSFATKDAVYLRLRDSSRGGARGVDEAYWRGFRMLPGAAVSVSVAGLEGQPLSPALGLDLVRDFVGNLSISLAEDDASAATEA